MRFTSASWSDWMLIAKRFGMSRHELEEKAGRVKARELLKFVGVLDVNVNGAFWCARQAARQMIAQGSGGDPYRDPHAVGVIRIPRDLSAPLLRLKVMGMQCRGEESRGEDVDG